MRNEQIIVNVIFDAAKGESPVLSREAAVGAPLGALPRPSRSGYDFEYWTLNGEPVGEETVLDAEDDVCLVAVWSRKKGEVKNSMYKKQKVAVVVLAVVTVVLALTLVLVNQLVSIYGMVDTYVVDGEVMTEKYYIRKKDGVYGLYDRKGNLLPTNEDGIYMMPADKGGNQYKVDPETGEYSLYAIVDTEGSEVLGFSDRVMLFPQITQKNTYSIQVTNQYGSYEFYRDATGAVKIKGYEESMVAYDQTLFASLCVSCGYTLSMQRLDFSLPEDGEIDRVPRLEDGSVDYDAYGLVDRYNDAGELIYSPAVYTITEATYANDGTCTASDRTYTVKVGDTILSGAGYYIQLEGKDRVYIVSSEISNTVLQPIEKLVTPMVAYPTTVSTYAMVNNFLLGNMNFAGSLEDIKNEEDIDLTPLVSFTFQDLESRQNSIYTSRPYVCMTDLMKGYEINSDNASGALMQLYEMEFLSCVKLGLDKESMKEYGLDGDVYYLYYESPVTDENNSISGYMGNTLLISQKTERGTYYIASFLTEMIVEVDQYYLSFLQWELSDWYDQYFFQHNISYINGMTFQVGDQKYEFTLDNSASYMYYENSSGKMTLIDLEEGELVRHDDGTAEYIDKAGTRYELQIFDFSQGGYYIQVYDMAGNPVGEAPYEKYMMTVDSKGNTVLHLYKGETEHTFEIAKWDGKKINQLLNYRVVYRDADGEDFTVLGSYTASDSKNYKDYFRLSYWQGSEYDDKTKEDAEWTRVEPVAGSIILRNKQGKEYTMSLGSTNLEVYCTQYTANEEGKLDYVINYVDSSSGLDKNKQLTGVDNFRKLYQMLMWYSIGGDVNEAEFKKSTGMSLKDFIATKGDDACQAIFTYSLRDFASNMNLDSSILLPETPEGSEEKDKDAEEEELSRLPEIKTHLKDTEMDVVIRLYQYSEGRSLLTVEVVENYDENGNPISDPSKAQGSFYVLAEYANEIIEAAQRLINQDRVQK